MTVKLLTEHHLRFLSLKGGCTGSSESTLVKVPHCWKSHDTAQMLSGLICWCTLVAYIPKSMGKTHNRDSVNFYQYTVKPVLSSHSKRTPTLVINIFYHLMQVKGIAECSNGSILQHFRPPLSHHFPLRPWFSRFLSGHLRQGYCTPVR